MEKRPLLCAASMQILGCLLSASSNEPLKAAALVILSVSILFIIFFRLKRQEVKGRKRAALLLILIAFLTSGFFRFFFEEARAEAIETYISGRDQFTVCGEICGRERKENYTSVYLKDAVCPDGNAVGTVVIFLKDESALPPVGSVCMVSGEKGEIHQRRNDGGFDERNYLRTRGIFLKLISPEFLSVEKPVFPLYELLCLQRERISDFFSAILPGEEGAVLSAMVLGDKSGMDAEVKSLFSASGIAHLLAVSGLHISIISMAVYRLLRKCRLSFLKAFAVSVPISFFYAVFTGFSISAQRALMMFVIYLFSQVAGKVYDMLSALSLASIVVLFENPFSLYDSVYLFSFGAALIVATAAGPVSESYSSYVRCRHRDVFGWEMSFVQRLTASFISAAVISLGTLPIVAFCYYVIPLYQVLLNVCLIPLMKILLPTALFGGIFSVAFFLIPAHFIIYLYEACADLSLRLPFSRITVGKPGLFLVILYYAVFFIAVRFLILAFEKARMGEDEVDARPERKRLLRRVSALAAVVPVVLVLTIRGVPEKDFSIAMLDVGQGDGICISAGTEIVFIDGGSTDQDNVGRYAILPFLRSHGIGSVDWWFITHCDTDHISGCIEAIEEGYAVKRLVFAENVVRNENYDALLSVARSKGTEIIYMSEGDAVHIDTDIAGVSEIFLSCLYAGDPDRTGADEDPNDNCLVLMLEAEGQSEDFYMLLGGDISSEVEGEILCDATSRKRIAEASRGLCCLKAAHHGSNGSNSEGLLDALSPDLCICSAGEKNRYGHPGKETLSRLSERGIPFFCTKGAGEIDLRLNPQGGVAVVREYGG